MNSNPTHPITQTSHILKISHSKHVTSQLSHTHNIPFPKHHKSQISHILSILHSEHATFQTPHITKVPYLKTSTSRQKYHTESTTWKKTALFELVFASLSIVQISK